MTDLASPEDAARRVRDVRLPGTARGVVSPSLGAFAGWVSVAATVGVGVARVDPLVDAAAWLHVLLSVSRLTGVGALVAFAVGALDPWMGGRPAVERAVAFVASTALAYVPLRDDFANFAGRTSHLLPQEATFALAALGAGAAVVGALTAGRCLRGRAGRAIAVIAGVAVASSEPMVLPGQYPALHALALVLAATLVGSSLTNASLRRPVAVVRLAGALGLSALATVALPIGGDQAFRLARDGDVLAPFVAFGSSPPSGVATARAGAFLRSRAGLPSTPPTPGERFAEAPIVLFLTVDCMRFDVVAGPRPRAELTNLRRLASEGLSYARAFAPGASTVFSLSAVFSGKPYSLLEWSGERREAIWPSEDPTPRFPELLREAGVRTVQAGSMSWLGAHRGVARGFEIFDHSTIPGPRWKAGPAVTDALLARIAALDERPALLYAHYIDAHHPYAGTRGTPAFERYVGELRRVDAEIGRLLDAIEERGLRDRTLVIVTSDHGEAFGEHRRHAHGNSLYDEAIHVPLLVRAPGARPRTIETPVSLLDLGPTILDLFGLATPAHFMGESLYPNVLGADVSPTRPIVAQVGRLRALVTSGLLKVIRDDARGTVESYDLRSDPGELRNLGTEPREIREALGALEAYFDVHRFRREGYVEPYRAF